MCTRQLVGVAAVSLLTGYCLGALLTHPCIIPKCTKKEGENRQVLKKHASTEENTTEETRTEKNGNSGKQDKSKSGEKEGEEEEDGDESDEGLLEIDSSSLNRVPGEVRMALVVRTDLGMQKGKIAAQCGHAAVTCYKLMSDTDSNARNPSMLRRWYMGGQAKIALKCASEEDLDLLFARALSLNINAYVVHDAGRTQIPSGSATVLGLGPAPKSVLDQVTGELRLL